MKSGPRHRTVPFYVRWLVIALSAGAIALSVFYIFRLSFRGQMLMEVGYFYLLIAFFLPIVFVRFPLSSTAPRDRVPWYDFVLVALAFGTGFYFFMHAYQISLEGWEVLAPRTAQVSALILFILAIEAARRTAGPVFASICLFFGLYPLLAEFMPGIIQGVSFGFWRIMGFHSMGGESFIGIPMQVLGRLLIGFVIFAMVLQTVGGATFFINLALALLGSTRGGAAKVAVFASSLMGTMHGSPLTNVVTTGVVTIPAMKRSGLSAHFAAAVESVASTGGVLMPPVMGAVAFVMAMFLGIPYGQIIKAAAIPALLFYLALFIQVDARAARTGLKGLAREELPSLKQTLKEGWFFLVVLAFLFWALLWQVWAVAWSPFIASALLILLSMLTKKTRMGPRGFVELIEGTGRLMSEVTGMLLGVGLIIGSLAMTGVAYSLPSGIVGIAGSNVPFLLVLGAFASFVLGMGMTASAVYIFLALSLAPALIQGGLEPLAVHLFVLYWAMLSFITPPVAFACYAASSIADASPMRTAVQAARLGVGIFLLPFFFVVNPALLLIGSAAEIAQAVISAAIGLTLIGFGMERYVLGIGKVGGVTAASLLAAGFLIGFPEWRTDVVGIALAAAVLLPQLIKAMAQQRHLANR